MTLKMLNESMGMCLPEALIVWDKLPEDDTWAQEDESVAEEVSEC